jgi:hypothetical protein
MNDASGENVGEHVQAFNAKREKLQPSIDNDNAHLDRRCVCDASSLV